MEGIGKSGWKQGRKKADCVRFQSTNLYLTYQTNQPNGKINHLQF